MFSKPGQNTSAYGCTMKLFLLAAGHSFSKSFQSEKCMASELLKQLFFFLCLCAFFFCPFYRVHVAPPPPPSSSLGRTNGLCPLPICRKCCNQCSAWPTLSKIKQVRVYPPSVTSALVKPKGTTPPAREGGLASQQPFPACNPPACQQI